MTALNSRSFRNLFAVLLFLTGCNEQPGIHHKCQIVIVLDKTNSVDYTQRLPRIEQDLSRRFARTYASATKDIQSSLLVITGKTSVFPEFSRFDMDWPDGEEGSRAYEQAMQRWNTGKRKWQADRVKEVVSRIDSPCNSNTTDVFSIFSGIQQVEKNDGPWDSINVVIFSDMVNTCRPVNMVTDITLNNARAKGKAVCIDLVGRGQIPGISPENIYLAICTPANMQKTGEVNLFWMGFFEQWGLKEDHYRFE